MSFLTPQRFVLMVIPAALLGGYLLARTRRHRTVLRFSSLEMAEAVAPRASGWRRRLTTGMVLVAGVVLVAAFARPVVAIPVPQEQAALVLAVDVSLSMDAADVPPSRLAAAQQAAIRFLEIAPDDLRIGLVAFAGTALPVLAPSADHDLLEEAVGRLGLAEGTVIGEAIFTSLDQLAAVAPHGSAPQAIVVLSDGETTAGRSELDGAAAAASSAVPVYTIAFDTPDGTVTYQGETIPVPAAAGALREVADRTGGRFYATADESGLSEILSAIGSEVGFETEEREVADWFAAFGLLLLAAAVATSTRWFGRVI